MNPSRKIDRSIKEITGHKTSSDDQFEFDMGNIEQVPFNLLGRTRLYSEENPWAPVHIISHVQSLEMNGARILSVDSVANFGRILATFENYIRRHDLNLIEVSSPFYYYVVMEHIRRGKSTLTHSIWDFGSDPLKMVAAKYREPGDKWVIFLHKPFCVKTDKNPGKKEPEAYDYDHFKDRRCTSNIEEDLLEFQSKVREYNQPPHNLIIDASVRRHVPCKYGLFLKHLVLPNWEVLSVFKQEDYSIVNLYISYSTVPKLDFSLPIFANLKILKFTSVWVSSLGPHSFSGLYDLDMLRKFSLDGKRFSAEDNKFFVDWLCNDRSVPELAISDLTVTDLDFRSYPSPIIINNNLKQLVLSRSQINSIVIQSNSLQRLNLNDNPIKDIDFSLFRTPHLRELEIGGCGLTEIPDLTSLRDLTVIELCNNNISSLKTLDRLPNALEMIVLNGNPISEVDFGLFERFKQLQVITLDNVEGLRMRNEDKKSDQVEISVG